MHLHTLIPTILIKRAEDEKSTSDTLKYLGLVAAPDLASLGYSKTILNRLANKTDEKDNDIFSKIIKSNPDKEVGLHEGGSHYNPKSDKINLNFYHNNPGVLAHEMGHAKGGKPLILANILGKLMGYAGTGTTLLTSDEDLGRNAAIAGTIGLGGTLASEIDASRRGYSMIRNLGGSRGKALKAFMGLPTYLAAATSPILAHKGKQWFNQYEDK